MPPHLPHMHWGGAGPVEYFCSDSNGGEGEGKLWHIKRFVHIIKYYTVLNPDIYCEMKLALTFFTTISHPMMARIILIRMIKFTLTSIVTLTTEQSLKCQHHEL